MYKFIFSVFLMSTPLFASWDQWRGNYDANGVVEKQDVVHEWSDTKNIIWKAVVPGKGHSSPVFKNNKIFLTTADDEKNTLSFLCYDQKTGKKIWEKVALKGKLLKLKHPQSDHAASTPVVTDDLVITTFGMDNSSWLVAVDHKGAVKWKKRLADFESQFGMGSSPLLYKNKVYVLQDNKPDLFVACYDIKDGKEIWRKERKVIKEISYSSPRIITYKGKDMLVVNGLYKVTAYDPIKGDELWDIKGHVRTTVGTPVLVGDILFCNGGYPDKVTTAYKMGDTPKLLWNNKFNSYTSSLIAIDNEIYVGNPKGFLACIDQKTGKINWKKNLKGKDIIASPLYINGKLYVSTIKGITKVVKPNAKEYVELASNSLEGDIFSSSAIVENKIYQRTAGYLYCIGKK